MKEPSTFSLAKAMVNELIDYQLRGRTYSVDDNSQYERDYNEIFDKSRKNLLKKQRTNQ